MRPYLRLVVLLIVGWLLFEPSAAFAQQVPNDLTRQGFELYQHGKPAEAITVLKRAVKQNDKDADGWHFLGLAYFKLEKLKDAQSVFERAVKLRPNFVPTHTSLAYVHLLRNHLKEASAEAEAALKLDRDSPTAHYVLGAVGLRQGNGETARREAEAALTADPKMGPALVLKSQALIELFDDVGDARPGTAFQPRYQYLREAAKALDAYLTLNPNEPEIDYWRTQLETLQLYSGAPDPAVGQPYSPNAVTTKARILEKPIPEYTAYARDNGYAGTVRIRAVLSFDGGVKHLLVLNQLEGGLTEQALRAAQRIRFLPATVDGRPVSQFIVLEYNFNIY